MALRSASYNARLGCRKFIERSKSEVNVINKLKIIVMRFGVRLIAGICWWKKSPQNVTIETKCIPVSGGEIRARIYTPLGYGPFPVIVYYHGGGFVIGDLDSHDPLCRDLCVKADRIIVSIEYRLAPENPFPCAPNDCIAALEWVTTHIENLKGNRDAIFVAGDSAGGNLAAVTAIQARDRFPGLLKGQILLYPVTHHYQNVTASYIENAKGQGLTRNLMIWFWDQYLPADALLNMAESHQALATPLAVANLTNLPPTLLITAEKDPLRDEGVDFAHRLSEQGVKVQHTQYKGLQHGFIGTLGPNESHNQGIAEIVAWLEKLSHIKTEHGSAQ